MNLRRKAVLLLAAVTTLSLAAEAPASAATPVDYGAAVNCRYRIVDGDIDHSYVAKLRKLVVTPPRMFATLSEQQVGWRFRVLRTLDANDAPWEITYTSPTQIRTATTTRLADFDRMSVGVTLPTVENRYWVWYRVSLQMFRYRADGSIKSQVTYLMPSLQWVIDNYSVDTEDYCGALAKAWADGPG